MMDTIAIIDISPFNSHEAIKDAVVAFVTCIFTLLAVYLAFKLNSRHEDYKAIITAKKKLIADVKIITSHTRMRVLSVESIDIIGEQHYASLAFDRIQDFSERNKENQTISSTRYMIVFNFLMQCLHSKNIESHQKLSRKLYSLMHYYCDNDPDLKKAKISFEGK